ncbi:MULTISPECIES: LytR/AlgR family response regulator transcription factor [Enterococcus]|uniref:Two-component system, LytTR family, response regulator AgrA n=1 Tax=Candidatus Enterococcus mangumiae TaxID=2230878 RepID=A0ABZ2T4A2_9ENTE|nr:MULTISPECIES: LytTR family DNA-binding domain-containing protein [unclassified Enterococcus]MBO0462852.1 response regulator transcription factor [Enterococcus sp. DIV1298c]MBO0489525.1 response regulator transcription factor [Enterococcus sp. DIV1094]MBO1301368.1 response regulator transcription factor [Enterococcus sp. DIV1271a]
MLKIFICDDQEIHRNRIASIVKNYVMMMDYDVEFQLATENPYDILSYLSKNKTEGIYFLDIDLNSDINGVELGKQIRQYDPTAKIIFVTTYTDFVYLTFLYKVEALDYIIKDNEEQLQQKIISCIDIAIERYMNTALSTREQIWLKSGAVDVKLYVDEILFFSSSPTPHKLIVHLDNRMIEYAGKIKEIEKLSDSLCRCHQSFVVNLANISEINKKERKVIMTNGEECLVSTRYLKKLVTRFENDLSTSA